MSYALTMAIIHSLWQSLIVIIFILGIQRLKFFKSADRKYSVYIIGLGSLFILFLVNIFLFLNKPYYYQEIGLIGTQLSFQRLNEYITESSVIRIPVHDIITGCWIAGVSIFLIRYAIGNLYINSIKKNGQELQENFQSLLSGLKKKINITREIKLISSFKTNVPLLIGHLKPIIVFPSSYIANLSPAQFESILIHELIHLKRNDYLVNQFQTIIECILFFNPFAWYLSNQIRKYREYSCDDDVQKLIENKNIYLKTLYKIAQFASQPGFDKAIALYNNKSELNMRVKRMLNQKPEKLSFRPFFSLTILIVLVIGMSAFTKNTNSEGENEFTKPLDDFINMNLEIPKDKITEIFGHRNQLSKSIDFENSTNSNSYSNETQAMKDKDAHKSSNEKLSPENSIRNAPFNNANEFQNTPHFLISDTLPNQKKIEELEKKLEEKSREMEELAMQFEKEYSQNMESEMKKMEELSIQLEERVSAQAEEWSKKYENSDLVKKIEELSRQMEQKIEEQIPKNEELNSKEVEAYEDRIEKMAKEMEKYIDKDGNISNQDKINEIQKQIEEESKKFKEVISAYEIKHHEVFESGEIKELQVEMEKLAKELSQINSNYEEMLDPTSKKLQEEMMELQKQMEANMKPMNEELQKKMQEKAMEIEKIYRALEIERSKKF